MGAPGHVLRSPVDQEAPVKESSYAIGNAITSSYTWIPEEVLHDLGVASQRVLNFEVADGSIIQRGAAQTRVRFEGNAHITWVVFGDAGSAPLLGAYTLEGFALAPDRLNQRIVPVTLLARPVLR